MKRGKNNYDSDSDSDDGYYYYRKPKPWVEPKNLSEKRKLYQCRNYVKLDEIPLLERYIKTIKIKKPKQENVKYKVSEEINKKISLYYGDICCLEIDSVVNAANSSLMGGGGIDGCIHRAAGPWLRKENRKKFPDGCPEGEVRISSGFRMPAKQIIHTVGPVDGNEKILKSCYKNILSAIEKNNIKSTAFCCVATGIFGFPLKKATHIALTECREWMEKNHDKVDRLIFCVYLSHEKAVYERYLTWYFPVEDDVYPKETKEQDDQEPETPKFDGSSMWRFPGEESSDEEK